jgi:hypothetical protein
VIAERSSAAAKVECFRPTMGRRSAFHFVVSRISIVVANSLVTPAIVGAGAVGWYGATREVGQEVPT